MKLFKSVSALVIFLMSFTGCLSPSSSNVEKSVGSTETSNTTELNADTPAANPGNTAALSAVSPDIISSNIHDEANHQELDAVVAAELNATAPENTPPIAGPDLRGKSFAGDNLIGNTELQGANLEESSFVQADLTNANLTQAKMGNSDLTKAVLNGTTLEDADLAEAKLIDAVWSEVGEIAGVDLRGSDLTGSAQVSHINNQDPESHFLTTLLSKGAKLNHKTRFRKDGDISQGCNQLKKISASVAEAKISSFKTQREIKDQLKEKIEKTHQRLHDIRALAKNSNGTSDELKARFTTERQELLRLLALVKKLNKDSRNDKNTINYNLSLSEKQNSRECDTPLVREPSSNHSETSQDTNQSNNHDNKSKPSKKDK